MLTYDFSPKDDVHNLQNVDQHQFNTTQSKNIIVSIHI